jgi:hypothetical protein
MSPTLRQTGRYPLDRDEYELFERRTDGSLNWRGLVRGLDTARVTLWLLAGEIGRECFAMDCRTSEIRLARAPVPGAKRVFQVAYSEALAIRAHLLHRDGYDVTSALGNQVAKFVLSMRPPYDLFQTRELLRSTPWPIRASMSCGTTRAVNRLPHGCR